MTLQELSGKKIALIGWGLENMSLVKFLLKKKIKCELTVCESRRAPELQERYSDFAKYNLQWQLGPKHQQGLAEFDILFCSPGSLVGKDKKIKTGRAVITSPLDLFLSLCPSKKTIGVSGTKGKGTTSSLIYEILRAAKQRAWLGGNIGVAPFDFLEKIKPSDWVVLEISSFQLERMQHSPHLAVLTNFSPEHLAAADPNNPNYHRSLAEYWHAKLRLAKFQTAKDSLIANRFLAQRLAKVKLPGKIIYFDRSQLATKLPGAHNLENIAAAEAVAKLAKVPQTVVKKAVANFVGLEHRLELVRELRGVKYYNDSFATTPESAITALRAFTQPIILLAGGADKGSDFRELAKNIVQRAKFVVLLSGQATPKIKKELLKLKYPAEQLGEADNIKSAVKLAKAQAKIGEIVVLSTGCASFGMFKNYKERGYLFKAAVNKLK